MKGAPQDLKLILEDLEDTRQRLHNVVKDLEDARRANKQLTQELELEQSKITVIKNLWNIAVLVNLNDDSDLQVLKEPINWFLNSTLKEEDK